MNAYLLEPSGRIDIQPDSHEVETDFQVEQNDSIAAGFCILQCLDALYHLQFRNLGLPALAVDLLKHGLVE